jgi:hypothetical protein
MVKMVKVMGRFATKLAAERYAAQKNKRARKYVYRAVKESFYGKPGYDGVKAGWTIAISRKKNL